MQLNTRLGFALIVGLALSACDQNPTPLSAPTVGQNSSSFSTTLKAASLASTAQTSTQHLVLLKADLTAFLSYLPTHWANLQFNEKMDAYDLASKISGLQNDFLANPSLTDADFFSRFDLFLRRLHDGHMVLRPTYTLTTDYPSITNGWSSGLRFEFAKEGIILTACEPPNPYAYPCLALDLPVLVSKIDNIPAMDWISSRADTEIGTMIYGRRRAALKSLSYTGYRIQGKYEPARVFTVVTQPTKEVTLAMDWFAISRAHVPIVPGGYSGPIPTQNLSLIDPQCVSSQRIGSTLFLRVNTFGCTQTNIETSSVQDARFSQQLEAALASQAPDFQNILVDLRDNGGGSDVETRALGAKFLSAPTFWYRISSLNGDFYSPPFTNFFTPPVTGAPDTLGFLTKPLWLLTNGGCFSACSMFVHELHDGGRAKVIGTEMDGGVGGPRLWAAPSGLFSVSIPSIKLWNQNDSPMEGTTVTPEVSVLPSLSDFQKESDPTLTAVLQSISSI